MPVLDNPRHEQAREDTMQLQARIMLSRIKPFPRWCAERPRSDSDKALFLKIVNSIIESANIDIAQAS
jgi:hypothetical protein